MPKQSNKNHTVIASAMPPELAEEIRALAKEGDRTVSMQVLRLVRAGLAAGSK